MQENNHDNQNTLNTLNILLEDYMKVEDFILQIYKYLNNRF